MQPCGAIYIRYTREREKSGTLVVSMLIINDLIFKNRLLVKSGEIGGEIGDVRV
jgi:hypothetical protein